MTNVKEKEKEKKRSRSSREGRGDKGIEGDNDGCC